MDNLLSGESFPRARGIASNRSVLLAGTLKVALALLAGLLAAITVQAEQSQDASSAGAVAAPTDTVSSTDYVIGPGDVLQVFVWRNPELSVTVPVRPDGKISTPLVEDMVAVGKTPAQLARDMEKVLGVVLRVPSVNIILSSAVSALSQVKIVGKVKIPTSVPYTKGMRVLDVVLKAGGMADFAAANRAFVVRTAGGKSTKIKINLNKLIESGDVRQNIELQPGDVIIVPESWF